MGFLTQVFNACFVAFNFCSHTKLGDAEVGEYQVEWIVSRNPLFSIQREMNR
jgi:hypothetical protein